MKDLLDQPPHEIARRLIGAILTFEGVVGFVVETEAYDAQDPAPHSFVGPTPHNAPMFGPPGRAYVYRSYGLHWRLNLVCGEHLAGCCFARWPTVGLERMIERRGLMGPRRLAARPVARVRRWESAAPRMLCR